MAATPSPKMKNNWTAIVIYFDFIILCFFLDTNIYSKILYEI